jgi:trans-aconitate methyltransferase
MERICEPELMNDPLQARAYAEADFSGSDRAFAERIVGLLGELPAEVAAEEPLRIVDLGCGPGKISFLLAEACPTASVLGLDGAEAMLALARQRQQAEPSRWPRLRFHQARLPLAAGELQNLPDPRHPPFGALVSNSLLHHLHDPQVLWHSLRMLGAPGSLVVLRDLRRPGHEQALEDLLQRHAAGAPAVLRRDYAHSLRAAFRADEVRSQLEAAGLPELAVREIGDRYLEVVGRLA